MASNQSRQSDNRQGAYTESELKLASLLGKNHIRYLTQIDIELPKCEGEDYYRHTTPDFIIGQNNNIFIYVDGPIHEKAKQRQKDRRIEEGLKQMNIDFLRPTNSQIKNEPDIVLSSIWGALRKVEG